MLKTEGWQASGARNIPPVKKLTSKIKSVNIGDGRKRAIKNAATGHYRVGPHIPLDSWFPCV